jgi:hypothetical protein
MISTLRSLGLLLLATEGLCSILPWKPSDNYPTWPSDGYPTDPSACPSCSKPKHCSNDGWDWGYFSNPVPNYGENYPGFRADKFKTQAPIYTDVTPEIGTSTTFGSGTGNVTIYNSSTSLSSNLFALNQRAYLWVCETGTWQFDFSGVDDIVLAWVGDVAYSGWTDENANARATYIIDTQTSHLGSRSFTADLQGGSFVPIRFIYGDALGPGSFRLTITSPSGIIVHQTGRGTNNDWIVRYSCPRQPKAPKFPAFGQES